MLKLTITKTSHGAFCSTLITKVYLFHLQKNSTQVNMYGHQTAALVLTTVAVSGPMNPSHVHKGIIYMSRSSTALFCLWLAWMEEHIWVGEDMDSDLNLQTTPGVRKYASWSRWQRSWGIQNRTRLKQTATWTMVSGSTRTRESS